MKKAKSRFPVGKIIAAVLIFCVVAAVLKPELLFFLSPEQQEAVARFQADYFTAKNPIQSGDGAFNPQSLLALALLIGECWIITQILQIFAKKVKMPSRHAETIKSLACNCLKYAVVIYALVFGLSILGVDMVAVIASLGVLGLIVGFGAQSLIEDVISGLFIILRASSRWGIS